MAPKSTAPKNWKQKELSSFLQKDGGTDKLTSTPKYIDEEQTTSLERLPSSGENLEPEDEKGLLCKNDKRGCCVIHGCTMRKSSVNTRKWGAKGDNNFGWIYKKVTQYSCQAKINARLSLAKSPEVILMSNGYEQRQDNLGIRENANQRDYQTKIFSSTDIRVKGKTNR